MRKESFHSAQNINEVLGRPKTNFKENNLNIMDYRLLFYFSEPLLVLLAAGCAS